MTKRASATNQAALANASHGSVVLNDLVEQLKSAESIDADLVPSLQRIVMHGERIRAELAARGIT